MASQIDDIVRRLSKRRKSIRGLVDEKSHEIVVKQAQTAFVGLSAMIGLLQGIAPLLTQQLVDKELELQRQLSEDALQRQADSLEAVRLRKAADAEEDPDYADLLRTIAIAYQRSATAPSLVDLKKILWFAGTSATMSNLLEAAEQVSHHRDYEAIKTLGEKSLSLLGKWLLKLTPVRYEDVEDFKKVWETLKALTEPEKDIIEAAEAAGLRKAQSRAASSLFDRLEAVSEISLEWCRRVQREPFIAAAEGRFQENSFVLEAALEEHLRRAIAKWDEKR